MEGLTKIDVTLKCHVAFTILAKGLFFFNQNNHLMFCIRNELIKKKNILRSCCLCFES